MTRPWRAGAAIMALALCSGLAWAGEPNKPGVVEAAGQTVRYVARLDETVLTKADGAPEARLITPVYERAGPRARSRPVLFAFNGGPGSSSVYLHLGVLGPRRLDLPGDASPPAPPYRMVANAETVLDTADLVLIDPVGTGLSRLLDPGQHAAYYSVDGEGRYLARFIRQWLAQHGRTDAPVFILGESYGAMRAVAITKHLILDPGPTVDLRGLMLVSQSIGVHETVQRRGNLVGQAVALPTLGAIAWYHHRAQTEGLDLQAFLDKVQAFATDDYLPALYAGNGLPAARREAIADVLARLTGVSAKTWLANDLQISKEAYRRLILADQGQQVGRNDARFTGPLGGEDPSTKGLTQAHAWAIDQVLGQEFGASAKDYRVSDDPQPSRWIYARDQGQRQAGAGDRVDPAWGAVFGLPGLR
uniref:Peptidase S10 serine carboxypeptidase n=1 Tax=Caulobacter sp. (strain K31) TaxID=366602 RepID=B0T925_CAUSK